MQLLAGLRDLTELHLADNAIAELNENLLVQCPNLQLIDLSYNDISWLPDTLFAKCTNLQFVDLSQNNIDRIPDTLFDQCSNLLHIDLSKNQVQFLQETLFSQCYSLHLVNLSHNNINQLPGTLFANSTRIKQLDLQHNRITELNPDILAPLEVVTYVNLAENAISNASFLSTAPATIITLNLSCNQICSISGEVFQHMINIQSLDLGYNRISHLDSAAFGCRLQKLQMLNLEYNNLSSLPHHVFAGMDKLEFLNISHNQLTTLHHGLFSANTSALNCGDKAEKQDANWYKVVGKYENTVTKFQQIDRAWQHFHTLDASYNQLTDLSTAFFSHHLAVVQIIDLSHNKLMHVPRLEHLLFLHTVNLSHNRINWLDVGVFNNPKLSIIDLSHNKLTKIISMAFLYLPALSHLDLSRNQINYIYKMAFYRTCKHGQAMTIDMSSNRLHNDVMLKLVNCFKHLQDTTCTVSIDLQHNALSRLLQQPSVSMHLLLQQNKDARFFNTWDHVKFGIQHNKFSCDCKLISDITVFEQMHKRFSAAFEHPEFLQFWQNATCDAPKGLKGVSAAVFYKRKSSHCHEQYICPKQCDCIPHSDHTFINCSHRNLQHPPTLLLPGPKILDLQGNHLHKLSTLKFQHVKSINLSFCGIKHISPAAWAVLRKITSVDLKGNLLSSLPVKNPCMNSLSLSVNPLDCGCSNNELIKWLINCSDTLTDFDNIRCADGTFFLDLYGEPCVQETSLITSVMLTVISMTVTFLVGVLIIFLVYHYRSKIISCILRRQRWYKIHAEEYDKYSLTIVHSQEDNDPVIFGILPILQQSGQYTCSCLQEKDWLQNSQRFMHSLQTSNIVLIVTSRHLSDYVMSEVGFKNFLDTLLPETSPHVCVVNLDESVLTLSDTSTLQQLSYNAEDFRTKLLAMLPPGCGQSTISDQEQQSTMLYTDEKY